MNSQPTATARPVEEADYPEWLDRSRYPFDTYRLDLPEGRVHYVDEGDGRPVVLLHGNPTWSFLYRHLVAGLSDRHRCLAPDLLGLSAAPRDFSYRPADHARVVERLLDALDLEDAVVVGHDWGGALGLDYAARNPDAVAGTPALLLWGMRDPVQAPLLPRFQALFPDASEVVYDVGHFVSEAVGPNLVEPVRAFLDGL